MTEQSQRSSTREAGSGAIRRLLGRVLEYRYLRGVSEEDREELQEDLEFIRKALAEQRVPRLAVVGEQEAEVIPLLETIAGDKVDGDSQVKEYLGHERWYDYSFAGKDLDLLDLRTGDGVDASLKAVDRQAPDGVLFLWTWSDRGEPDAQIENLERVIREVQNTIGQPPPIVAVVYPEGLPENETLRDAEHVLRERLRESSIPHTHLAVARHNQPRELATQLVEAVPVEARLRMTRLVGSSEAKESLARLMVQTCAGLAAGFAAIPLPVADMVPITSTQVVMIAAVAFISGRSFNLKTVGEFAAAVGINVGAGLAIREIVRALVQFIPVAGSALSGTIATGATLALGNAAIGFFIED